MKESIIAYAKNLGFDDIRFAGAAALKRPEKPYAGESPIFDPKEIMPDANCVIVLFTRYSPVTGSETQNMCVSEYYRTSNRAYKNAKYVAAYILESGARAELSGRLYTKGAALKTGGFAGRNGLYYHETLGSTVCIHTILTSLDIAEDYPAGLKRCGNCTACAKACPTAAITKEKGLDTAKCLRKHLSGLVPEDMRTAVYQLFGCEKCQTACPLNSTMPVSPLCFNTAELLNGAYTEMLSVEVGKIMARPIRVLSQALLYAGAVRDKALLPFVEKHVSAPLETVREHALWAKKRLNDEL